MAQRKRKFYGPELYALGAVVNPSIQPVTRKDVDEVDAKVQKLETDLESVPTDVTQLQQDVTDLENQVADKFDKSGGTINGNVGINTDTPNAQLHVAGISGHGLQVGPRAFIEPIGRAYFGYSESQIPSNYQLAADGLVLLKDLEVEEYVTAQSGLQIVDGQENLNFQILTSGSGAVSNGGTLTFNHSVTFANVATFDDMIISKAGIDLTGATLNVNDSTGVFQGGLFYATGKVTLFASVPLILQSIAGIELKGPVNLESATTFPRVIAIDENRQIVTTDVTPTEMNFVSGVTSNVQDQLDQRPRVARDGVYLTKPLTQSDTVSTAGATSSIDITFPIPYTTAPVVTATGRSRGVNPGDAILANVSNVTATGCTLRTLGFAAGSYVYQIADVHWQAVGETAV